MRGLLRCGIIEDRQGRREISPRSAFLSSAHWGMIAGSIRRSGRRPIPNHEPNTDFSMQALLATSLRFFRLCKAATRLGRRSLTLNYQANVSI
jgi:hypothetical protein